MTKRLSETKRSPYPKSQLMRAQESVADDPEVEALSAHPEFQALLHRSIESAKSSGVVSLAEGKVLVSE